MLMIKLANCFYNIAILYRVIYMDFSTNLKGFYQMLVLYCLCTDKYWMALWKQVLMMTIIISGMTNRIWTINIPAVCEGSLQSGISPITGKGGMESDINNDSEWFRPITAPFEGWKV